MVVALRATSSAGAAPHLVKVADSAVNGGNQALCSRSFTHRCVSVGIKKDPDRVRFIRAILKSKGLSMWSCLPLCLWVQPKKKKKKENLGKGHKSGMFLCSKWSVKP